MITAAMVGRAGLTRAPSSMRSKLAGRGVRNRRSARRTGACFGPSHAASLPTGRTDQSTGQHPCQVRGVKRDGTDLLQGDPIAQVRSTVTRRATWLLTPTPQSRTSNAAVTVHPQFETHGAAAISLRGR